jgi:hypothetical protein
MDTSHSANWQYPRHGPMVSWWKFWFWMFVKWVMVSRYRLCPVSDAKLPAIIVGFQSSEQTIEWFHLQWSWLNYYKMVPTWTIIITYSVACYVGVHMRKTEAWNRPFAVDAWTAPCKLFWTRNVPPHTNNWSCKRETKNYFTSKQLSSPWCLSCVKTRCTFVVQHYRKLQNIYWLKPTKLSIKSINLL